MHVCLAGTKLLHSWCHVTETTAVMAHILCTPNNHVPVYSVRMHVCLVGTKLSHGSCHVTETTAVMAHILCTPYDHVPAVYNVGMHVWLAVIKLLLGWSYISD